MKNHVVLRLDRTLPGVPHWESFILDKGSERTAFGFDLDEVLRAHGVRFWVTQEYEPADASGFDEEERACGLDRVYRVIFRDEGELPAGLVDRLRLHPAVEAVRVGAVGHSPLPQVAREASVARANSWPSEMIGLSYAHAITLGHPDVKVAILDTGVDLDHPELEAQIRERKDVVDFEGLDTSSFLGDLFEADDEPEDEVGHGTHVAGIIAGRGLRMARGVSPGCGLMAVRVLAALRQGAMRVGAGLVDNINVGIKWAVDHGADVVNMSLGIRHEQGGLPHEDVIRYARHKGVTVVAAAGNDGTANKYYPGALPGVVAVGAVDPTGQVAPFSSFGARISLLAPGTNILSSFRDGGYAASSGTSQAAPFVSGAIGLLRSWALERGHRLTDRQVQNVLRQTSDRIDRRPHHPRGGHGILNLTDAFKYLDHELTRQRDTR